MTKGNRSHITRFGLPGVDRIPFGMHACHLYRSREDLLAALVPYVVEGLRASERCIWVTAPPLPAREACQALEPYGVDEAIETGALVVHDFDRWYTNTAGLKGQDVVLVWLREEARALAEGYNGIRIAGNISFVTPDDWSTFLEYEQTLTGHFKNRRIVALCSYVLTQCTEQQVSEVVDAHQWALQRSGTDSKWFAHFSSQFKSGLSLSTCALRSNRA
jgi:hypothetical protein